MKSSWERLLADPNKPVDGYGMLHEDLKSTIKMLKEVRNTLLWGHKPFPPRLENDQKFMDAKGKRVFDF